MKKLSLYIVLLLLLAATNVYSQKTVNKDNYTFQVQKEKGDLNKDNILDEIFLKMDTIDKTGSVRLQIYLSQPNTQKLKLVVSSIKIIEPQYPIEKKGKHNGNPIPDFFIEEGVLRMLTDINNRKSIYIFRYKNENFELTEISRVIWDGKNKTFETEIDLIAKTKIEFEQELGSDEILNKKAMKIKVSSLPKIQDLDFSQLENY